MPYSDCSIPTAREAAALYESVGWSSYTDDTAGLIQSLRAATYLVTYRSDEQLVGLARGLSDDVSIFYLQDILVDPAHQRNGIGTELLRRCLERFDHVRQKVLLTDDDPAQHRLYTSAGYSDVAALTSHKLHAFVQIRGVDLT